MRQSRRRARPSLAAIAERVAWWSELFEIPCAGYAASLEEVALIAAAGADFVMVEHCIWSDSRSAATALMDVKQAIRQSPLHNAAVESR